MPYQKGESGNPSGRPKGSKNKRNLMSEALFDYSNKFNTNAKEQLIEQYISLALAGDKTASKFVLERLIPK